MGDAKGNTSEAMKLFWGIVGLARGLRYRENWVTAAGAWTLVVLVFLVTWGAIAAVAPAPGLPVFWRILLTFAAGCAALPVWLIGRQIYWRTGKGRRIGLSYEGYRLPPDDWAEIRRELGYLFEHGSLDKKVSIKVFPGVMTATEPRWQRTEHTYRLSILFRAQYENSLTAGEPPRLTLKWRTQFDRPVPQEFAAALVRHA